MNNTNYFIDMFESILDYQKIVSLIFLIQNDKNLLKEIGFSKNDFNLLNLEFKNVLLEECENYFNTIFEVVRHERSLILLLSLVESDILKQSKFTNHEIEIIKNIALEKLHRQRILKEVVAMDLLENS